MPLGSLQSLMDELVAVEETVHHDLRVFRWRTNTIREFPCIFNWLRPGRTDTADPCFVTDMLDLRATVCVRHTDTGEGMERLEEYADAFREVIDAALAQSRPLGGLAMARRSGMGAVFERFGDVPALGIEFPLELWLKNPTTFPGS